MAPFYFTKICRPIISFLGALLIRVINFVDDFLFSESSERLQALKTFINMLLHGLGWTVNDSKSQEGHSVRFLGYTLDASLGNFQVPVDKVEKAQQLLTKLTASADATNSISTKLLESTLGTLLSARLAIPLLSVFTRDLYTPWKDPNFRMTPGMSVTVTPAMRDELTTVGYLLTSSNGAPFMDAKFEIDLFVDASEIGWGATALGRSASGLFHAEVIGKSSTFRELLGLLTAISHHALLPSLTTKVVRFTMDSKSAICNLVRGGGPVTALRDLIKQLWNFFLSHKITPIFRWFRRDRIEMQFVDNLSKSVFFNLLPAVAHDLQLTLSRPILYVEYGEIPDLIQSILGIPRKCYGGP